MRRLLTLCVLLVCAIPAFAQRTFYISYGSGNNNNNGTSTSTPWKSHPYMQTGASCTGTGTSPSYSHQVGDQFIFKGGDTWPVGCFVMTIPYSGTSSAIDYFGACGGQATAPAACSGATWPSTGWTRPKFDMAQSEPNNNWVIAIPYNVLQSYLTFDDLEIANQNIFIGTANSSFNPGCAMNFVVPSTQFTAAVGISVYNMYIHDWVSSSSVPVSGGSNNGYCWGGIDGATLVDHLTMSDANGWGTINGSRVNGPWGGGVWWATTLQYSTIHDVSSGTEFQPLFNGDIKTVHDSEFYNISQSAMYDCIGSTAGYPGCINNPTTGIHSDGVYDNQTVTNYCCDVVYNNYIHDTAGVGVTISLEQGYFFNNVETNFHQNLMGSAYTGGSPNSTNLFNNTIDCSAANGNQTSCVRTICSIGGHSASGYNVNNTNNIFVIVSGQNPLQEDGVCTVNTTTNHSMLTSEAATYGFTEANKYYPTNINDTNVKGTGTNLSSSCSSSFLLCQDASGAPWFGGSSQTRNVPWDMGAYVLGGGGPPPGPTWVCAPTNINWPNQPLGYAFNPGISTTCTNSGGQPLTMSSIAFSGGNAGDFSFTTSPAGGNCGTTVAAGGSCTITVNFLPTALGNRSTTLVFANNASSSPQTISVSGTSSYKVQDCSNYTAGPQSSLSCTFASAPIGKSILCSPYLYDTTATFAGVSDGTNTYNAVASQTTQTGNGIQQSYLATGITGASPLTVTATLGGSSTHHGGMFCREYVRGECA